MSTKTILIISLSDKKDRLSEERDARKKLLSKKEVEEDLVIEFYYPDPKDHGKIHSVLKKRKPHIVVFDGCCHNTVHHYHKAICEKVGVEEIIFCHKYTSGALNDTVRESMVSINSLSEIKEVVLAN
jgi:hypothetical protein